MLQEDAASIPGHLGRRGQLCVLVGREGVEPVDQRIWWEGWDSNPRSTAYEAAALGQTKLPSQMFIRSAFQHSTSDWHGTSKLVPNLSCRYLPLIVEPTKLNNLEVSEYCIRS